MRRQTQAVIAALVSWAALLSAPTVRADDENFMPWAPATAGLPRTETSAKKIYVHGIKPSVGMDDTIGPPLSAVFVATVRKSSWAADRTVLSGDEVRMGSPNVATYVDACASGPCVVEIARSVGCGVAISATVSKVGTTYLVDAMAVETESGSVVARETERVRGKSESSLLDSRGLPKVVKGLIKRIPELTRVVPPTVAQAAPPPPPPASAQPTPTSPPPAQPDPPPPTAPAEPQTAPPEEAPTPTAEPAAAPSSPDTSTDPAPPEEAYGSTTAGDPTATDEATAPPTSETAAVDPASVGGEEEGSDVLGISGYVLLGAGLLVGAIGGGAHLAAFGAAEELKKRHAANQVQAIISQGIFYQNTAFVLYGIGAAGLLVGLGLVGGSACL